MVLENIIAIVIIILIVIFVWGIFKKLFKVLFYVGIVIVLLIVANSYFIYKDITDLKENFQISTKKIILVDEVLSVGDLSFQEKCLQTFDNFKRRGKTIVFVTHDVNQILRVCDRAMMLNNAKIEKIGAPSSVIEHYIKSQNKN